VIWLALKPPSRFDRILDLVSSGGADIARDKDSMIAEAYDSRRRKTQRR
jgi:hypothetical protein